MKILIIGFSSIVLAAGASFVNGQAPSSPRAACASDDKIA